MHLRKLRNLVFLKLEIDNGIVEEMPKFSPAFIKDVFNKEISC